MSIARELSEAALNIRYDNLPTEVIRETGSAMLLVTHNPEDAARADRVVFMRDGAFEGDAALEGPEVSSSAVHDRLKELGI